MSVFLLATVQVTAAFLTAFAALLVFSLIDRRKTSRLRQFTEQERDAVVFIFENETLLDATPAARQLLDAAPREGTVWARLAALLGPRFPRLSERVRDLADLGEIELRAVDGSGRLSAEWHDGVARITLEADDDAGAAPRLDKHSLLAMSQELDSLRAMADHVPHALWRETESGSITWCNSVYLQLADALNTGSDPASWPPARLFETGPDTLQNPGGQTGPDQHRASVTLPGGDTRHWFDVSVALLPDGARFCSALPADRLVEAENTHREFVTTLTKTFAALPIGLAIFDRARELTLFNPALMDLTFLPAEFLISRPSLPGFFDKLREARMIPEQKDYKSWRQLMSDLVMAAESGSYEQTWTLPTGQTYRVTGRPHPDGAVALLFEDISAEITVARRFRTEIETGQAVLDALPQAVVVFTLGGVLSLSNSAYAALWGRDPSTSFGELTLGDAVRGWRAACAPTPIWDHLQAFAAEPGQRRAWTARVSRTDGRTMACTVAPLFGGGTMVSFADAAASGALPEPAGARAATVEARAGI